MLGYADLPEEQSSSGLSSTIPGIDASITEPEIVSIEPEEQLPNLERWTVASPAMGRNIDVQILRMGERDTPAPMLYLLDGVDAPADSGWLHEGRVDKLLDGENVTVVMPTEAYASMYVDWYADDPALGRQRWETFLTEELPPLLEDPAQGLDFNGNRAIAGLSMGASGAVALANTNPGFYEGVIGISGCYSNSSTAGRIMVGSIVENAGASVYNLYGPEGGGNWDRYDVVADPSGLAHSAVYLSAAEGAVTEEEEEYFGDRASSALANGVVLEWGALSCTVDLAESMEEHGMVHQHVAISEDGVHNWPNFAAQLRPGWEHISPSMY